MAAQLQYTYICIQYGAVVTTFSVRFGAKSDATATVVVWAGPRGGRPSGGDVRNGA